MIDNNNNSEMKPDLLETDPQTIVEVEVESVSSTASSVLAYSIFESSRFIIMLLLFACGLLYLLMGCLCISYFKNVQMMKVMRCYYCIL